MSYLLNQYVPDVLDVELLSPEDARRFFLVDPESRRELGFVRKADTVRSVVTYYRTIRCLPTDPEHVSYDGQPTCRRFAERVVDAQGVLRCPTYEKRRPFDVVERSSGAVVKQVRPA